MPKKQENWWQCIRSYPWEINWTDHTLQEERITVCVVIIGFGNSIVDASSIPTRGSLNFT